MVANTIAVAYPRRILRAVLWWVIVDLKGADKAREQQSQGRYACFNCWLCGDYDNEISRMIYGDYRRCLPAGDPQRTDPSLGPAEARAQWPPKPDEDIWSCGMTSDLSHLARSNKKHPARCTGVTGVSALFTLREYIPHFHGFCNMFPPEMMHLFSNIFKHYMSLASGKRTIKKDDDDKVCLLA